MKRRFIVSGGSSFLPKKKKHRVPVAGEGMHGKKKKKVRKREYTLARGAKGWTKLV